MACAHYFKSSIIEYAKQKPHTPSSKLRPRPLQNRRPRRKPRAASLVSMAQMNARAVCENGVLRTRRTAASQASANIHMWYRSNGNAKGASGRRIFQIHFTLMSRLSARRRQPTLPNNLEHAAVMNHASLELPPRSHPHPTCKRRTLMETIWAARTKPELRIGRRLMMQTCLRICVADAPPEAVETQPPHLLQILTPTLAQAPRRRIGRHLTLGGAWQLCVRKHQR